MDDVAGAGGLDIRLRRVARARRNSVPAALRPEFTRNYSLSDGISSTTVYYTNHCSKAFKVTVHKGPSSQCWSTPKGKGEDVFVAGITRITKGC